MTLTPKSISNFNAKVFPASYVEERRIVNLLYSAGIATRSTSK